MYSSFSRNADILPLLCNSDFYGISEIHGQLIRRGTCGTAALATTWLSEALTRWLRNMRP